MSELTPDYEAYFYDTMLRLAEMDECTMNCIRRQREFKRKGMPGRAF